MPVVALVGDASALPKIHNILLPEMWISVIIFQFCMLIVEH